MDPAEKQRILEELGGIPEDVYDELVRDFASQLPSQISQMKDALHNNDFDSLAQISHAVKGSSGNLRIHEIQEFSRIIEQEAKEGRNKQVIEENINALEKGSSGI